MTGLGQKQKGLRLGYLDLPTQKSLPVAQIQVERELHQGLQLKVKRQGLQPKVTGLPVLVLRSQGLALALRSLDLVLALRSLDLVLALRSQDLVLKVTGLPLPVKDLALVLRSQDLLPKVTGLKVTLQDPRLKPKDLGAMRATLQREYLLVKLQDL